jgi:hypothetical protein
MSEKLWVVCVCAMRMCVQYVCVCVCQHNYVVIATARSSLCVRARPHLYE